MFLQFTWNCRQLLRITVAVIIFSHSTPSIYQTAKNAFQQRCNTLYQMIFTLRDII